MNINTPNPMDAGTAQFPSAYIGAEHPFVELALFLQTGEDAYSANPPSLTTHLLTAADVGTTQQIASVATQTLIAFTFTPSLFKRKCDESIQKTASHAPLLFDTATGVCTTDTADEPAVFAEWAKSDDTPSNAKEAVCKTSDEAALKTDDINYAKRMKLIISTKADFVEIYNTVNEISLVAIKNSDEQIALLHLLKRCRYRHNELSGTSGSFIAVYSAPVNRGATAVNGASFETDPANVAIVKPGVLDLGALARLKLRSEAEGKLSATQAMGSGAAAAGPDLTIEKDWAYDRAKLGIYAGHAPRLEVAAFEASMLLANSLGYAAMVPTTVLANIDKTKFGDALEQFEESENVKLMGSFQQSSVQAWMPNGRTYLQLEASERQEFLENLGSQEARHLMILDLMLYNTDRNYGNILIVNNKGSTQLFAIDNSLIGSIAFIDSPTWVWASWSVAGTDFTESEKKGIASLQWQSFQKIYQAYGLLPENTATLMIAFQILQKAVAAGCNPVEIASLYHGEKVQFSNEIPVKDRSILQCYCGASIIHPKEIDDLTTRCIKDFIRVREIANEEFAKLSAGDKNTISNLKVDGISFPLSYSVLKELTRQESFIIDEKIIRDAVKNIITKKLKDASTRAK
jgi:hypothetical protein